MPDEKRAGRPPTASAPLTVALSPAVRRRLDRKAGGARKAPAYVRRLVERDLAESSAPSPDADPGPGPVEPQPPPPAAPAGAGGDGPGRGWHMPPAYADIPNAAKRDWDGRSARGRPGEFMWLRRPASGGRVVLTSEGGTKERPAYFVMPEGQALSGADIVLGEGASLYGPVATRCKVTLDGADARVLGCKLGGLDDGSGFLTVTEKARDCLLQYATIEDSGRLLYLSAGKGLGFSRCFFDNPKDFPGEGPFIYLGKSYDDELSDFGAWVDECLFRNDRSGADLIEVKSRRVRITRNTVRGSAGTRFKQRHSLDAVYDLNFFVGPHKLSLRGKAHRVTRNAGERLSILLNEGNMPATGGHHQDGGGQNWQTCEGIVLAANAAASIGVQPVAAGRPVPVTGCVAPTQGRSRNARANLARAQRTVTDREVAGVDLAEAEALASRQSNVGHAALLRLLRGDAA